MFILFVLMSVWAGAVLGGTPCPPREDIYPCTCINVPLRPRVTHTIVSCHRIGNPQHLNHIFKSLRTLQIDQFFLYDSFWDTKSNEANSRQLPSNWITLLKVREMEIVDTPLSAGFACDATLSCKNTITKRFTVVNSTSSEHLQTICEGRNRNMKFSWTGCFSKLQEFHFSRGQLNVLRADLFHAPMNELRVLNLTRNQIAKVEKDALKNLRRLVSLDLSHNNIQHISAVFGGEVMNLEKIDLSWNQIQTLPGDLLPSVPELKVLSLEANLIEKMEEKVWEKAPSSLRNIDLTNNPLHCDCNVRWINSTFHINVVLLGRCATPEMFENSLLRRASRALVERCDSGGNIGTRPPKTTTKKFF